MVMTKPGLYLDLYIAQKCLPGKLSFKSVHGYLLGHISIDKLAYTQDTIHIQAKQFSLLWEPKAVLHQRLKIQSLDIKALNVMGTAIENFHIDGYIFQKQLVSLNILGDVLSKNDPQKYPLTAKIRMDAKNVQAEIYLDNQLASLILQGQHTPKPNIDWKFNATNLTAFSPLSGQINASGKISGEPETITAVINGSHLKYQPVYLKKIQINLEAKPSQNTAFADVFLKPGDLIIENDEEKQMIPFQKMTLHFDWKNNQLFTKTQWIFDGTKRFEGECQIRPSDQKLSGSLSAMMDKLDFLNTPTSPIKKIQGSLQAQFQLGGTFKSPAWNGTAHLKAQGVLPDLGLNLDKIDIMLTSDPKNMLLKGQILSGKKALLITGESKTFDKAFKAQLKGENFPLMNTKEYEINVSPDLSIQWKENKITIDGNIDIPSAVIQPMEFSETLELPSDVEFVSNKKKKTNKKWDIESHINIRLGKNVLIDTHGVTGRLEGAVMVIDKNNAPTIGDGEISMRNGQYEIYGQKLQINQGKASFNLGPIDNPQLFIRAERVFKTTTSLSPLTNSPIPTTTADMPTAEAPSEFNSITVGVEVTGYLKNPAIRLFSNPATLSQSDILSFLVLGRPLTQASSADGELLFRALSAMNIGGNEGSQITQQLQSTFGLDIFNVETQSQYDPSQNMVTSSTSLVIGKMLSPKLMLNYSIGLLQNTNIVKVKYFLTPKWIFQTQTDGTNEGVDILYSFTRE